ncbi:MAG: deoxyribose-phosphate aldolase [Candidatus Hydrogenedentes bacterium]|nr:deoxyribose-phosphate aldolase [Candidatus Hydrogenedentota bacterium]
MADSALTRSDLAALIDHTQVKAFATQIDMAELCDEAAEFGLAAVTINPAWTSYCAKRLEGTSVAINSTIGFPLGASTALIKVEETREAIANGATELDMVINIGALKSGFSDYVGREIDAIVKAAGDLPVKVILETCFLTDEEKRTVCQLSLDAGASFVKTSTGFGSAGATVEDVRLMREAVGNRMGVKAAGGIRRLSDAKDMLEAGASRIGTSATPQILAEIVDSP